MLYSPLSRLVALSLLLAPALPARAAAPDREVLSARDLSPAELSESNRSLARERRHQAMEMLRGLVSNQPAAGGQRSEMLLRLAELEMEEARDLSLDEQKAYADAVDACYNTPGCAVDRIQEARFTAASQSWYRKAASHYGYVLSTDPAFARADEALYGQASALLVLGQATDANRALTTLVRDHAESPLAVDAYVLLGEQAFEAGDLPRATLAYRRAASFKGAPLAPFAQYKLAWCLYNTGDLDATITTMKGVLAMQGPGQVQDEALRDLTRFMAEAGQVRETEIWLTSIGRADLIPVTLRRMAEVHLEQGRDALAIQTWQRVLALNPTAPDAPATQGAIVGAWRKIDDKPALLKALTDERERYGPGSAWEAANASSPDVIAAARDQLEKDLRGVASRAHEEARRIGAGPSAVASYALASAAYAAYLDEFPSERSALDMRYAYAELLYKVKRYEDAFAQYNAVLDADPGSAYARECAEGAVYAAAALADAGGARAAADAALSPWEERLIAATDRYVALFPTSDKVRAFTYRSAYLLYDHDQLQAASTRFRAVIALDPSSTEAEQAANLILDSFALSSDWESLVEVSRAFYQQPGLGSAAFKRDVHDIYENASLKRIEARLAETGQRRAAADAWVAFAAELPGSKNADLALNNAAATYDQVGDLSAAMAARRALVDRYAGSRFYADAVLGLAAGHEALAEFAEAAAGYETLYKLSPAHPRAADALYSAAVIRGVLGQADAAINDYQHLLLTWPDDARAPTFTLAIGDLYASTRRWDRAAGVYLVAYTRPAPQASVADVFRAAMGYGEALSHQPGQEARLARHWADTLAAYDAGLAAGKDMTEVVDVAGELRYRLAQPAVDRALALAITGPSGRVTRASEDAAVRESFNAKLSALREAESALHAVVETRSGTWGLAAMVQLGRVYENMAATLDSSYVPTYLTPEQRELYVVRLKDGVYAQNQKAIEAYELAVNRSFELNLYNQNSRSALASLSALDPVAHEPMAETVVAARFLSPVSAERGPITEP